MPSLKWSRNGKGAPPADSEGRMPLIEHIRELRRRLVRAILGIVAGMVVGFLFFDTLWDFMKQPYCRLPIAYRDNPQRCSLYVQGVFDGFMVNLKVAALFGLIIASPIWLYQIWAFVTPGLYRNERRYSIGFLGLAIPLFLGGAALAYLTMDKGLSLLLGFVPGDVVPLIGMDQYLGFALAMVVIFGISFELPLLLAFLNAIGVLPHAKVKKHRRLIIFLMFVFAAIATPSQDPFTMLALALPMVLLFMAAELFMYLRERRRGGGEEDYSGLADDEASPLDLGNPRP